MPNMSAFLYYESRAGTTTLSPVASVDYLSNEFNTGSDTIQAKSTFPFIYYSCFGADTKFSFGNLTSATNSNQPYTSTVGNVKPTTNKTLGINNIQDFRSNTLERQFSPIEDVTCNIASVDTTSEDMWGIIGVTDYPVVPNQIGAKIDYVLRGTVSSGTIATSLVNSAISFDNSLTTLPNPLYKIIKADVCSPAGANELIFAGLKFSDKTHALPLIPRSSTQTTVHPINNIPDGFIFDSNTPPELQTLCVNSATADIFIDFYLQKL